MAIISNYDYTARKDIDLTELKDQLPCIVQQDDGLILLVSEFDWAATEFKSVVIGNTAVSSFNIGDMHYFTTDSDGVYFFYTKSVTLQYKQE